MGEITKIILDGLEEEIRSKELQERQDKLRGLPEKTENWNFEQFKLWFDTELEKRITNESKNIFLNDSIQRAEKGLKSAEITYGKIQSDGILYRINEGGKYLTYLREKQMEGNPKEEIEKPTKDKLTHKQQILLLKQLGFFDLEIFKTLSTVKKGKLTSHLLNRTEKVSLEVVRGLTGKPDKDYKINTKENIKVVNELLSELDLKEYLVK